MWCVTFGDCTVDKPACSSGCSSKHSEGHSQRLPNSRSLLHSKLPSSSICISHLAVPFVKLSYLIKMLTAFKDLYNVQKIHKINASHFYQQLFFSNGNLICYLKNWKILNYFFPFAVLHERQRKSLLISALNSFVLVCSQPGHSPPRETLLL